MKNFFVVALIVFLHQTAFSQYWEVGALLGASNYMGDLAPSPVVLKETHLAGGALVRYNANPWISYKGNIYFGSISGSDQNANINDEWRRSRNLHFKSTVLEFGFQPEINLTGFETGNARYRFSPYVFAGIGIFRFNPKARHYINTEEWIPLQPLGTEGQEATQYQKRKKYALTQVSIPIGAGFKTFISDQVNFGFELGFRKTFTDYLDDVSKTFVEKDVLIATNGPTSYYMSNRSGETGKFVEFTPNQYRGNPETKDWYIFTGFTLTVSIFPNPCPTF
jgi:hypothetical protein